MNHSVQIEGFCTLGRFIDEGSQTIFGDQFVASISDLPSFNRLLTRGPCDYNVARTLGVNYIWDIPSPR
jgi:hypothetical protein